MDFSANTAQARRLPVLCFHRFGQEAVRDDFQISFARLEGGLAWLRKKGYESISLTQVAAAMQGDLASLPSRPVCLSVDDGYLAGWDRAGDLFQKYGFHAVYFVVAGCVGHKRHLDWDRLRQMEKAGFEIGCHGYFHSNLARPRRGESIQAYQKRLKQEVFESKALLETKLGHEVVWFAYPYGAYNALVTEAVRQAGYKLAFTATYGINLGQENRLQLKRILITGKPGLSQFASWIQRRPLDVELRGFADGDTVSARKEVYFKFRLRTPMKNGPLLARVDEKPLHLEKGLNGWWYGFLPPAKPRGGFRHFSLFARRGKLEYESQWLLQAVRKEWNAYFVEPDWKVPMDHSN